MLTIARLSTALPVIKSSDIHRSVSILSHHIKLRPGSHSKRLAHGRGMNDVVLNDIAVLTELSGVTELCDAESRPISRSTLQASDQTDESERKKLKIEAELSKVPVDSPLHSPSDVKRTAKRRFTPS